MRYFGLDLKNTRNPSEHAKEPEVGRKKRRLDLIPDEAELEFGRKGVNNVGRESDFKAALDFRSCTACTILTSGIVSRC